MFYCNDFISRPVLSLYEGELIGNVDKLLFDKKLKKLLYLEIIGENDNHFLLPTKNIYNVGKNALTIKNNTAVSLKIEDMCYTNCPINAKAFNIKGEFLGIVKEVLINDKYLTEKVSLENDQVLEASLIASCGKNTIIFNDKTSSVNVNKFVPNKMPKIFKTKQTKQAKIMPLEVETAVEPITPTEPQNLEIQNTDFLLGKTCTKDIYNFNNELLVKAKTVINKKTLKEILRFGKLRELMLYSK